MDSSVTINTKDSVPTEQKKTIFYIPSCHDKKFDVPVDIDFLAENLKCNLEAYSDIGDEYVTFIIRTQDDKGEWFFGMATTSLKKIASGDEIYLTPTKTLIVK